MLKGKTRSKATLTKKDLLFAMRVLCAMFALCVLCALFGLPWHAANRMTNINGIVGVREVSGLPLGIPVISLLFSQKGKSYCSAI